MASSKSLAVSVPKNNLDEVLRRTASGASFSLGPLAPSLPRTSKFTPSLTTPVSSSIRKTSTMLPSFSTPGFQKSKVKGASDGSSMGDGLLTTPTIHDVSSPVCIRAIKRTSSDSASESHPNSQKRMKREFNKENERGDSMKSKNERSKSNFTQKSALNLDDMGIERDPWKRLNQDFPLPDFVKNKDIVSPDNGDLISKTTEELSTLLIYNHRLLQIFTEESLQFYRKKDNTKDITLLTYISEISQSRIDEINKVLNLREVDHHIPKESDCSSLRTSFHGHTPDIQSRELSLVNIPANSSCLSVNDQVAPSTKNLNASNQEQHIAKDIEGLFNDVQENRTDIAASDDDYWATMDDIGLYGTRINDMLMSDNTTYMGVSPVNESKTLITTTDPRNSPYYTQITQQLRRIFQLQQFRPNQLEAITAAMEGRDVLVLMPTGGGKSLCYQLPAVCQSGVTVVVSPLLALMKDQVTTLVSKQVDAFLWNSETSLDDVRDRLYGENAKPNLLYVTPEKLQESHSLKSILSALHRKNELTRFVIDEAHCISTWGQDFRIAYQKLGSLRSDYESVPIMALTATANPTTIEDIKHQLCMQNHAFFTQSFNRPNLRYIIKPKKPSKIISDLVNFIQTQHAGHSGIIYCIGREKCENVAQQLRENGIRATHYHAKIPLEEKDRAFSDWKNGSVDIIVATIAFGMGIDKADVRFVIHYDLAKTLSGYYQETGRAGRDGEPADCVLYYSYHDFMTILRMIRNDGEGQVNPEAIQRQEEAARDVVKYCLNISDCRRVQLLRFFGEKFDKKDCRQSCDNCSDNNETVLEDVTVHAKNAIRIIHTLKDAEERVTLNQLQTILRGANLQEIREKQHDKLEYYASAKDVPKELLELMLQHLLYESILVEITFQNNRGFHNRHVEVGPSAEVFLRNKQPMIVQRRSQHKSLRQARKQAKSNAPPGKSKRKANVDVDDDPIEIYDGDFPNLESEISAKGVIEDRTRFITANVSMTTASISSLREVLGVSSKANFDPAVALYKKMQALRDKIIRNMGVLQDDVFSDRVLELFSVVCPEDYSCLKDLAMNALKDVMDHSEAEKVINSRFESYGQEFLTLCIQHKMTLSK